MDLGECWRMTEQERRDWLVVRTPTALTPDDVAGLLTCIYSCWDTLNWWYTESDLHTTTAVTLTPDVLDRHGLVLNLPPTTQLVVPSSLKITIDKADLPVYGYLPAVVSYWSALAEAGLL